MLQLQLLFCLYIFADPQKYKDKKVAVEEAYVADAFKTWKFRISQKKGADGLLTVFGGGNDDVKKGALVRVLGTFIYWEEGDEWEIKIQKNTADKVEILEKRTVDKPEYRPLTIKDLNSDSNQYENKLVKLSDVVVVDIKGSWLFRVSDSAAGGEEMAIYGSDAADLGKGDRLNVYGKFIYYEKGDMWEIKVRRESDDRVENFTNSNPESSK